MINLTYHSNTNTAHVYSADDYEKLRKEHRIIGVLLGKNNFTPLMPVRLYPEEVVLLVKKGIAKLVQYEKLDEPPTEEDKNACEDDEDALLQAQAAILLEGRKHQLEQIIDKVVAGKRKKGDQRSKEEILQGELSRNVPPTKDTMITMIPAEHPEFLIGKPSDVAIDPILSTTSKIRCAVFEDMWQKGNYITAGEKFGGDFCVYKGDPSTFHSAFVIRCIEDADEKIHPTEIVAFGRLGNTVKKRPVFAHLDENDVPVYTNLSWLNI